MFNGVCYATQKNAALAACSSYNVFAGDGSYVRCNGTLEGSPYPTLSTTSGGLIDAALSIVKFGPNEAYVGTYGMGVMLQPCERYDYDYWAPVIGAWVAAVVAVIAARLLYVRVFNRESL